MQSLERKFLDSLSQKCHSTCPPFLFSHPHSAAAEIRCFARLLQNAGAAAPSIHRTYAAVQPPGSACDSGTAVHVHVNVCNASARGDLLSPRQILEVLFAWVRFELLTVRFARPWMWREPSCLPLFATGPEFTREKAQAQARQRKAAASAVATASDCAFASTGDTDSGIHVSDERGRRGSDGGSRSYDSGGGNGGSGINGDGGESHAGLRTLNRELPGDEVQPTGEDVAEDCVAEGDVPAFFTQVHAVLRSEGFEMLEEQVCAKGFSRSTGASHATAPRDLISCCASSPRATVHSCAELHCRPCSPLG